MPRFSNVCFLYKKPVRNSVLRKFSTHKIDNLLELQKHVLFINNRDYFYYCSWNLEIRFVIVDIS